ncbi:MAG TPA: SRPBCC domain-containing protein, partial [Gemmatimonadaceae bacterium]|nr:SRPBCC domain-containing protein [Gemmatimonadaceae bacterium]
MTAIDRATTDNGVVRAVIDIAASPEDVFEALTNPRELAAWLGGVDDYSLDEWNDEPTAGVTWCSPAIGPNGKDGTVRGEFLVVEAPRRLVSTWHASWDQFERTIVRYELEPEDVDGVAGTRV